MTLQAFRPKRSECLQLPEIDLEVSAGEIVVIMGSSGVGKTTLIDAINGDIGFSGQVHKPPVTFNVYQGDNQLFPWMSIRQNFELAGAAADWYDTAERWKIHHLVHRRPLEISGGQRQRFVLLRSVYRGAQLLLCDEPLNHLDSLTARFIAQDFKRLVKSLGIAVLWITHSITEASYLADRCYLLNKQQLLMLQPDQIEFGYVSQHLDQ